MKTKYPQRIICLTEETTELLYLLGEGEKIVGISGFTKRPPEAKKTKPVVSTFIDAKYDKIEKLNPDFVLAFSDLQAEIGAELVKRGIQVVQFNQRSIEQILQNILVLGSLIGANKKAERLVKKYERRIDEIKSKSSKLKVKPKVYFEEWFDPLISGICWVSELIEIAGGEDIFNELKNKQSGKERIVNSKEVVKRNPNIIIASWCGRKFKKNLLISRVGWKEIDAVKNSQIYEIDSSIILQPGPAALTDGLDKLFYIIQNKYKNQTQFLS